MQELVGVEQVVEPVAQRVPELAQFVPLALQERVLLDFLLVPVDEQLRHGSQDQLVLERDVPVRQEF